MGRKKNPENKTRIEDIREKLEESKQNQNFVKPNQDEGAVRDAFSEFWAQNRQSYNRPRDLEPVIWAHLKSSGYAQPHLFEAGLQHFGLKK
jgi:hypothetical protein